VPLVVPWGQLAQGAGSNLRLHAVQNLELSAGGLIVAPPNDGATSLGWSGGRWSVVYAAAGTINTSAAEHKTGVAALDPAAALAAVRATTPVTFDYLAPPASYELPDDPEQAQAVLEQRLRNDPLAAAARHQAGVVLDSPDFPCDALFATGEGQTNPSNTCGILLAALKNLDSRLTSLGA
jgi:hypothetical protein